MAVRMIPPGTCKQCCTASADVSSGSRRDQNGRSFKGSRQVSCYPESCRLTDASAKAAHDLCPPFFVIGFVTFGKRVITPPMHCPWGYLEGRAGIWIVRR